MEKEVIRIIAEVLKVDQDEIKVETRVEDVAEWDSLSHLLLIEALETKLKKNIDMDAAMNVKTVQDLIDSMK